MITQPKTYKKNIQYQVFITTLILGLLPEFAYAATLDDTIGRAICDLVSMMQGGVGKSIATLAVMFLGIGAFFGKTNWGLVLTVSLGISIIFGAPVIAESLGITGASSSCTTSGTNLLEEKLSKGLCAIVKAIAGPIGKGLATLSVVFIGLAALFGKASWQMAITTAVGVGTIFGASVIVKSVFLTSGMDMDCLPSIPPPSTPPIPRNKPEFPQFPSLT